MKGLVAMASRSAWNRRAALAFVVAGIALSTFLMLGMERVRQDVKRHFADAVSGTDLIVGARSGSIQLLLYSVFRIGSASNNMTWKSAQELARHRAVAWTVPISLGDTYRGYPVVATSAEYFERFLYGDRQALVLAAGRRFASQAEAVLGADVAEALGHRLGDRVVLAHGDGAMAENDHAENPFVVVGVLARTGTPVDRSVHIDLDAMDALHRDAGATGMPGSTALPGAERTITAVLVGLKSRAAVFSVQRWVSEYEGEPLQALLPGVALDELWSVVGIGERALLVMGAMVSVVGIAGMVAVILAGLDQRRRELSILRAVGAAPRHVLLLLALEGAIVTAAGVLLGALAAFGSAALLGGWFQARFGLALRAGTPSAAEWAIMGGVLAAGCAASLIPALRAYRLSLADGLSPRS